MDLRLRSCCRRNSRISTYFWIPSATGPCATCRGEPNPMKFPATGSQFGILDYCGFPKDEAWYLKSWWTDEPVLHILPHWNLQGHEGDSIDIWVYSNCDEVELTVNGKKLDRKPMPRNGHLSWKAVFQPGVTEYLK